MTAKSLKDVAHLNLVEICRQHSRLLDKIATIVAPHADDISNAFYQHMLSWEESRIFLDNALVDERLHRSMAAWIRSLYTPRTIDEITDHIEQQAFIGEVHARINIPMYLVNVGAHILKRELAQLLFDAPLSQQDKLNALLISGEVLDNAINVINEVYLLELTENERASEALRIQVAGTHLAVECERLKASLLDWLRLFLMSMVEGKPGRACENIQQSDFGLWLFYRADMFFPDLKEVAELKRLTESTDTIITRLLTKQMNQGTPEYQRDLAEVNNNVTRASWLLTKLAEDSMRLENGRDSLTRLFNRRHLPPVMQRQIEMSRANNTSFSVLLLDIDHFKRINDKYGHKLGDTALRVVADLLVGSIRIGDIVFRYGGEEFLVVLSNTSASQAGEIAEKLCRAVENHQIELQERTAKVTISIGAATFFGHPDYTQLIDQADEALLEAKRAGRNRWHTAPQER